MQDEPCAVAPVVPSLWFKSSYSNGAGGECVECAHTVDGILVRDSKCHEGPVVAVPARPWQAFICALAEAS
jgi:hypothetical protein